MPNPILPIPDLPISAPMPKWWGHSLTIWGTIITTLSTVLPIVGPALGINLPPELIRQLGDGIVTLAQATGGVAGTALTIWGRVRATAPIERRQFTLTM